tara:strand:+ start:787 stop:1884 length:1098 start_codon:yes stop_codon:yes gene_type:complete
MSKKFNIKPPAWPREYTFQEFAKLNSHIINENKLITLYNQYLNKYLTELGEKKIHFKQSKIDQLITEFKKTQLQQTLAIASPGGGDWQSPFTTNYSVTFGGNAKENYATTTFNPADFDLRTTGFTVSYWVKPDELGNTQFAIGRFGAGNKRWTFGIQSSTEMFVGIGNTRLRASPADHGMEVGQWYHWVYTYSGTSDGYQWLRVYKNGVAMVVANDGSEGGAYVKHNRVWPTDSVDRPVYFGARNVDNTENGVDNWWACSLTDIAFFNEMKDTAPGDYNAVDSDEAGPVPDWVTETYNGGVPTNLMEETSQKSIDPTLIGYWRFEEGSGTHIEDLSGKGNHGTLTSNTADFPTWSINVPENWYSY